MDNIDVRVMHIILIKCYNKIKLKIEKWHSFSTQFLFYFKKCVAHCGIERTNITFEIVKYI